MPAEDALALDLLGGPAAGPAPKRRARKKKVTAQWSLRAFGADWCPPWFLLGSLFDTLEGEGIPVERIDVDADPTSAERHRIVTLPTVIVLREGVERRRLTGAVSLAELRRHVEL